ncbi:hypothetical protein MDAP_001038 [Mitosporidium daphniae]|uniref:RNA-binding S4 domain-containing protein n=1 Tax=Mitosporidium daphniae TaxID=1485682 RepID=A0A098VR74_9MICR|nr:uncharacterized protein DI09_35p180 [Mitosporidium daphniae]KGG51430.1 hypothetical protein DI09_35p180 [Mitosporidium daphniae]|eukprot:XP_013237857.1 uncharacterized protein DI09_35p180 [Mitosporidium daphniae]
MRFTPLKDHQLDVFAAEWKSKTLCRLFFNGDVTHRMYRREFNGENFRNIYRTICEMERRVDNVLFRAMLSPSVFEARKLISIGQVYVNGAKIIGHPSLKLKDMDMVQLGPKALKEAIEIHSKNPFMRFWAYQPPYIETNLATGTLTFLRSPKISEIPHPFTRQMIDYFGGYYRSHT